MSIAGEVGLCPHRPVTPLALRLQRADMSHELPHLGRSHSLSQKGVGILFVLRAVPDRLEEFLVRHLLDHRRTQIGDAHLFRCSCLTVTIGVMAVGTVGVEQRRSFVLGAERSCIQDEQKEHC
jgi:hypothetical protein